MVRNREEVYEWLMPRLLVAYRKARRGKRGTVDEIEFERSYLLRLAEIAEEIAEERYMPGRGTAFVVRRPVVREVFSAPFRDRVVHHLLFDLVYPWWDRHLIFDDYACRVGKGTLVGIRRLQKRMMQASLNGERQAWVLKLDVLGYFRSPPREKLYERVEWGLRKQYANDMDGYEYGVCRQLWEKVIFDEPTRGVRTQGWREDWRQVPRSKSLFYAKPGCGMVLGNLTSQLLSNIYLDMLDRYVVYELGFRHYGRYVDDFYLVAEDRRELVAAIPKIDQYLKSIGLTLHPRKMYLQEVSHGVDFLGAVVYPWRVQAGARVRNGLRRAYRYGQGAASVTSYIGAIKHGAFSSQETGDEGGGTGIKGGIRGWGVCRSRRGKTKLL